MMTKIEEVKQVLAAAKDVIAWDAGYIALQEGWENGRSVSVSTRHYLLAGFQAVKFVVTALRCIAFGHRFVDDSYAGPESGSMGVCCTRCGWSHRTILY